MGAYAQPDAGPSSETRRQATVFIVDDDAGSRNGIDLLVRSVGLPTRAFTSAAAFLDQYDPSEFGCLVLDVRMPGLSGLDLQRRLERSNSALPIIFVSAHAEVSMAVAAMKHGALDFLEKPYSPQELLDQIGAALERGQAARAAREKRARVESRIRGLSPRLREVLALLTSGRAPKQIAFELGVSLPTIYFHRRRLLERMNVETSVELCEAVAGFEFP